MPITPTSTSINDLLVDTYETNLKQPAFTGDTTLTVYSISNFTTNQILLIGNVDEGSEIIKTNSSIAPSGFTITLASALLKDHPGDLKIYSLDYDFVEVSSSLTLIGTKTVLATVPIDPETPETIYKDTSGTAVYFFSRFYNSITGDFSAYGDPVPITGYTSNTVGYIVEMAMSEMQKEFTKKLTYETLLREINACLRYVRGKLKRWSSSQVFNANLGQATRGLNKLPLPIDYYNQNSNRSCLDVRVGTQDHLIYVDKQEFDNMMVDIYHTTLASTANIGDTTLTLDNSADFPQTGTLSIYVNNTLQSITYTANNISTNTISGIPSSGIGSVTAQILASTDIWSGLIEGEPQWFTIYGGYLYWWYPTDEIYTGRTVYMDYWTDIAEVDSEADVIPLTKFDMVNHWLKWTIRNITERNGKPDMADSDFQLFTIILNDAIRKESTGQKFKMLPKVSGVIYKNNINPNQDYENYLRD